MLPPEEAGDLPVLGPPVVGGREKTLDLQGWKCWVSTWLVLFWNRVSHVAQDNFRLTRMTLNS